MRRMDSLVIAGRGFRSRLIVGTGKYRSGQETARAIEASGAEMVTVAVRRINLDRNKECLLDFIDRDKYFLLPNTGGGLGVQNAASIRFLHELITGVALVIDAGVGTAPDAAVAMALGADAVRMNAGFAAAQAPVLMAEAMRQAVIAGRAAYLAGRMS